MVFSGEVLDITPVPNQHGPQFMPERRVLFRVEKMWRGAATSEIIVMTGAGGGDCGVNFEPGARYLVYTYSRGGVPWTSICSRTQRLQKATEDLTYLATLDNPSRAGRIFGAAEYSRGSGTRRSKPAAGYVVTLRRDGREWKTKTDASGRYEFPAVQPGQYYISIELQPGERAYADTTVEVRDARGCGKRDFFVGGGGAVTVRVLNARREPTAGVNMEILDAETLEEPLPSYRHAASDGEGQVTFAELPLGRYVVVSNFRLPPSRSQPFWRVFHPGTRDQETATVIELQQGQHLDLQPFVLPEPLPDRVLRGTVLWRDGAPVSNAWVTALPVNTVHYAGDTRTDRSGNFTLQLLEDVRYTITAHHWRTPKSGDEWLSPNLEVQLKEEYKPVTLVVRPYKRE
jgi:hypothetical protein